MPHAHTIVVGDVHMDWHALLCVLWHYEPELCIVAGDFGWWPSAWLRAETEGYPERSIRQLFMDMPEKTEIRFIDGNHEDLPDLFALHGSLAADPREPAELAPNLWYQPRGSVFELADGRAVLFCGGGKSVDAPLRKEGVTWFPEEIVHMEDLPETLPAADVVISHTVPASSGVLETLKPIKEVCERWDDSPDETCAALDRILRESRPKLWLASHLHVHRDMEKNGTRFIVLDQASGGPKSMNDCVHVLI